MLNLFICVLSFFFFFFAGITHFDHIECRPFLRSRVCRCLRKFVTIAFMHVKQTTHTPKTVLLRSSYAPLRIFS